MPQKKPTMMITMDLYNTRRKLEIEAGRLREAKTLATMLTRKQLECLKFQPIVRLFDLFPNSP